MVEYKCSRCAKVFNKKYNYNKHLNRKKPCKCIISCKKCGKIYSSLNNLKRHHNNRNNSCFSDDTKLEKDEIIEKLVKIMSNNYNVNNGVINNTTNINTQNITHNQQNNNINIVSFGKEDLSFISDQLCTYFLDRGFKSVPRLIEYVHFNEKFPQFHNIYFSNLRQNLLMVFKENLWKMVDRNDAIEQLIDDKLEFLTDKFEELQGSLKESVKKKFNRFLDEHENNFEVNKQLKKDIKLLLYNGRAMTKYKKIK